MQNTFSVFPGKSSLLGKNNKNISILSAEKSIQHAKPTDNILIIIYLFIYFFITFKETGLDIPCEASTQIISEKCQIFFGQKKENLVQLNSHNLDIPYFPSIRSQFA